MKLGPWSTLFWSQEDQRNSTMLSASTKFKEVVLWVIFFFVSGSLDTFLCHSHISAQVRLILSAHTETQENQNRNTVKGPESFQNSWVHVRAKWLLMIGNSRVLEQSPFQWYLYLRDTRSGHKRAGESLRCRIWDTYYLLIITNTFNLVKR